MRCWAHPQVGRWGGVDSHVDVRCSDFTLYSSLFHTNKILYIQVYFLPFFQIISTSFCACVAPLSICDGVTDVACQLFTSIYLKHTFPCNSTLSFLGYSQWTTESSWVDPNLDWSPSVFYQLKCCWALWQMGRVYKWWYWVAPYHTILSCPPLSHLHCCVVVVMVSSSQHPHCNIFIASSGGVEHEPLGSSTGWKMGQWWRVVLKWPLGPLTDWEGV